MKKNMFNYLTAIFSCAVLCFAVDVRAEEEEAADVRPVISIDQKFIENKTSVKNLNFAALVDRLTHEFTQLGVYRVVNAKDMEELLKNNEVEWVLFDDIGEPNKPLRRACYIRFVVSMYGWRTTTAHNQLYGTNAQQIVAELEAILFLVDSKTGKQIKSVNLEPVKVVKDLVTGPHQRSTANLGEVALQEAARKLAKASVHETIKITKFAVYDVDGKTGKIMIEPAAGFAKVGDCYKILRPGKKIKTRRGTSYRTKDIGILQVTEVDEEYSNAVLIQLFEKDAKVKEGDMIQFLGPSPQTDPPKDGGNVGQPW